jgi:hypothetical protein
MKFTEYFARQTVHTSCFTKCLCGWIEVKNEAEFPRQNPDNKLSDTTAKNATVLEKYIHFVPKAELLFQTQWNNSKPKCPKERHTQPCLRSRNSLHKLKLPSLVNEKLSTTQKKPKGWHRDKEYVVGRNG